MKTLAITAALSLITALPCEMVTAAEKEPPPLKANANQEIDIMQNSEGVRVQLHVSSKYFSAYIQTYDVQLFSQAPDWDICEASPGKKLYCKMKLTDWLKRGAPLKFLQLGSLPDWPTIRDGTATIQNVTAARFALPYVSGNHSPVPIARGRTGNLLALQQFTDTPVGTVFSTFYQVPRVGGLPLDVLLFEDDNSSQKYNSLFLFSGAKKRRRNPVQLEKIWVAPLTSLPSIAGMKECKDTRALYVNDFDQDGMNALMR